MNLYRQSFSVKTQSEDDSTNDNQVKQLRKWYTDIYTIEGDISTRHRLPLFTDKKASESFLMNLQEIINRKAAHREPSPDLQEWIDEMPNRILKKLVEWKLVPARRAAATVCLKDHLKDFKSYLENKGNTLPYCHKAHTRIESVLDGCKVTVLADVSESKIQKFLADEIQAKHIGRKTANHYIAIVKTFFHWLIQDGRAYTNPVEHIGPMDTAQDNKRQRRSLTADEMRLLLRTTANGPDRRGITGPERAMHYETAAMTGLRAAELRALKVSDFDFGASVVRLAAKHTKNRQDAVQPLKPDLAKRLKEYLSGKKPDSPAFKTAASSHEVRVLRQDLEAAKIKEVDDSGRVFDFHSFRVFYASMLAASGTNPKTAMELMRHSDIRLTMNVYSHAYRESLTAAVDTLPDLSTPDIAEQRATGTDDVSVVGTDCVSIVKNQPQKSMDAGMDARGGIGRNLWENSAKPDGNNQKTQNIAKPLFQGKILHSCAKNKALQSQGTNGGEGIRTPVP
jgi:integrase